MIRHSKYHQIDSAIIYGFAVLSVLLLSNVERIMVSFEQKISSPTKVSKTTTPMFNKEVFSKVTIQGKAYVVYDIIDQKIIAGKNENVILPLASLTKVMTTVTARIHNDRKKSITITQGSIDGAYDLGLRKGQVFDLDELLKYTLVFSSNDGAQAIADGLGGRDFFVAQMNTDAKELGLPLVFTQPAGLDENGKVGGEGSALSFAKLLAVARRRFPEVFEATIKTRVTVNSSTGKIIGIPNTNQDVINFPGLEMSKTGFTDKAGGNLVVIIDVSLGHPIAIVVLGSTREDRFSDVEALYTALQKSLTK
jgi:D-alanyl-D-alanine carboxypeptidase